MSRNSRKLVYGAFLYGGGFHLQRWRSRLSGRWLTILNLHRVDDTSTDDSMSLPTLFLSIRRFEGMLEFLREHYQFVSLDQILTTISGGGGLPTDACHITFDDAYQDVFDHALPRLKQQGIPATIFVPADFVAGRRPSFWWDECYYLLRTAWERGCRGSGADAVGIVGDDFVASWERLMACESEEAAVRQCLSMVHDLQSAESGRRRAAIEELWSLLAPPREPFRAANRIANWETVRGAVADGFSVGSHTCSHCFLDREPDEVVRAELSASKEEIERQLGRPVEVFAYPGGKITDSTKELVAAAGYKLGMTTARGVNSVEEPPMLLKRVSLWNGSASGEGDAFSRTRLAFNLRRRIG